MRRWLIALLGLPVVLAVYACGGPQVSPNAAEGETCPLVSAGPPPVCPEGCDWNGKECRKHSGIIMDDLRDGGGTPRPAPTR